MKQKTGVALEGEEWKKGDDKLRGALNTLPGKGKIAQRRGEWKGKKKN